MTRTALAGLAAATLALASAMPAQAQDYRFDIGINGGGAWYTNSLDVDDILALDGLVLNEVSGHGRFKSGWLVGAQATWWPARLVGIRANFAYNDRPFEFDGDFDIEDVLIDGILLNSDFDLLESVNLWSGTGDVMIRFLGPRQRRFLGVRLLPYVALGAGAKWVNAPGHRNILVDVDEVDGLIEIEEEDATPFVIGNQLFALKKDARFLGLIGLGSDIRLQRHFALRAEIGDRIWKPKIIRLIGDDEPFVREDVGKTTHEFYATLGAHVLLGLEEPEPEPVAIAPAPPPPAPEPVDEETVTVCVIDPTTAAGIGMVDAVFVPSTNDTLLVVGGRRVDIETATGNVVVARETGWYTRGEPLTLMVEDESAEFVTFGGARIVDAEDLAYLGTVDGLPVYADEQEVQDINEELLELADADDLEEALEQRDDLAEDFNEIQVLYVPLQPTGCIFQPVRRVEEVRKIRR